MIAAITIILLTVVVGILGYLTYINYIKYERTIKYTEAYVRFISAIYLKLSDINFRMKEIDQKGSFRADDEVGHTFNALKECTDELYTFISRYVNTEEKKTENK